MKTLIVISICICTSLFAKAQEDSMMVYLNMSIEELLKVKITTAGKQEQQISDIPASVVVITRNDIESYGYQSLKEILSNILGMYKIDDYRNISFGVRGFFSNVYNRNIVFMINGIVQQHPYLNWNDLNLMNIQIESIERIEIVRGPAAVVYGNDAFFGAINIITHQNGKQIKSSATSSYGLDNTYRGNIQINSATDNTTLNISAGYCHTNGRNISFEPILDSVQRYDKVWINNGTTKDYFQSESKYFNVSASHKGFYANLSFDQTNRYLMQNFPPVYDTINQNRNDLAFRTHIGYRKELNSMLTFDFHFDFLNAYTRMDYTKVLVSPEIKFGNTEIGCQKSNIELLTFIKPIESLNFTLGANYSYIPLAYEPTDVPALGVNRFVTKLNSPVITYSAFMQGVLSVNQKIKFFIGLRADKQECYDMKNTQFIANIYKDTIYNYTYDKVNLIPSAAIVCKFNDNNILKLMFSQANSRPSIFENSIRNYSQGKWPSHSLLIPQTISTSELNYNSVPLNNLTFSIGFFYNTLNNLINRRTTSNATTGNITQENNNTGELSTLGGELQLIYKPIENLKLDASFSYQKTTNKLFDIDAGYSPNVLAYFKAIYTIKKNIILGLNSYFVGSMESNWDEINNIRISKTTPGYFNLGANLRFNNIFKTGFYFSLHAENILSTDIFYAPTLVNNSYFPNGTYDTGMQFNMVLGLKF